MTRNADIQSTATEALGRFFHRVSTRDMQVLDEFAPAGDVLLVGSDAGEIARGRSGIGEFFARIYERPATFSWQPQDVKVSQSGDIAWFFAEGHMRVQDSGSDRTIPYRISGVLERVHGRWLWRQYHGSEPVEAQVT